MEYELGIRDRLVLLAILPAESGLATIRIINDMRLALAPTEAEFGDLQMEQIDTNLRWNVEAEEAAGPRSFEIGAKGQEIIRDALKALDDEKKLTANHLDLCDTFEYEG